MPLMKQPQGSWNKALEKIKEQQQQQTKKAQLKAFSVSKSGPLTGNAGPDLKNQGLKILCQHDGVQISVGYSYSRIVSPKAGISLLSDVFSARARNAQFTTLYQRGLWDGRHSMINKKEGTFGTGLLHDILEYLRSQVNCLIDIDDVREVPEKMYSFEWMFPYDLRDIQTEAIETLKGKCNGIIRIVTGGGKCWGKGTPIMMWDGTVKPVEDVQVGDVLMGDDSTPRTVLQLGHGRGPLYKVIPVKGNPYIVNDAHILALKLTGKELRHIPKGYPKTETLDIEVKNYLNLPPSVQRLFKGYRAPVTQFGGEAKDLPIPPYLFGAWLGDGSRYHSAIHNPDEEVLSEVKRICESNDVSWSLKIDPKKPCPQLYWRHGTRTCTGAKWWFYIEDMGLTEVKFIPHEYKTASWNDRLELLAGLLDTDGYLGHNAYDIVFKYKQLADDLAFVARSLGLAAYVTECQKTCTNAGKDRNTRVTGTYYRVSISGDVNIIPCRVHRKKAQERKQKKDVLKTGITLEYIGEGDYYGFVIDGNHRLLMGDFTVTHNTILFSKLIQQVGLRAIVCVPSKELLYQTAEVLDKNIGGKDKRIGLLGDGHWPDERSSIVVAMYPSLVSLRGKTPEERAQFIETMGAFDLLICDECHKVCSNDQITKTWETVMDINAYYRYGFSATPFEKKDTVAEMLQRSAFGNVVFSIDMEEAREAGYVTPFTVYMLKPKYPAELTRCGTTGMTWQEAHEEYLVNNEKRNEAVVSAVKLLLDDGRKVMVVAQRIAHNEYLAKACAEAFGEENVYMLHGQLDSRYRKKSLAEYKARKTPCVMVASSVGNDGIDIPDISGLVLAHGGKSFFQNVQRAGRGLRATAGKEDLVFIDFDDSELGRWFQQHTNKRVQYYRDLGAKLVLV